MSTISLRIPNSLHQRVKHLAKADGVSVNQYVNLALTEKLSVMEAMEYISERAKRGSYKKFEKVLSKVSHREPLEYDKL